mgnify:CR=1 FL=1
MLYPDGVFHLIANGKVLKLDPAIELNRYYVMPIEVEIEQYTGLKDENGKEITARDIISMALSLESNDNKLTADKKHVAFQIGVRL